MIFTSDHGEEFLEHGGVTHGKTLHRELLHVPLIVRLPSGVRSGTSEPGVVQHADLLPSILDAVGVPSPSGLDGEPVLHRCRGAREVASHLDHDGHRAVAITGDRWTFIRNLAPAEGTETAMEVYDLQADPLEVEDLAGRSHILTAYGRQRIREQAAVSAEPGPTVSPADLDRLRALGYVGP